MKNLSCFTISLLLFSLSVKGQSPLFSRTSATYTHLTGATRVVADSVWDDPDGWPVGAKSISLGFTFKAFGKSMTSVSWEQGGIYFQDLDTVVYVGLEDVDMCDMGFGSKNPKSPLLWKRDGNPGTYVLKMEWQNFGFWDDWDNNGTCKDSGNVQLWIHQNPPKMELHFGNSKIADFSSIFPDGIRVICAKFDAVGNTSGMILDGNAGNPTTYAFSDTGTRTIKTWPLATTVYEFSFGAANGITNMDIATDLYYATGKLYDKKRNASHPIAVYTMNGDLVKTGVTENGSLDLNDLKAGIYIAKSAGGNDAGFLRFMKTE